MKKNWPLIEAVIGAVVISTAPAVQGLLVHHPAISGVVLFIYAQVKHYLPSPFLEVRP